MCLYQSLLNKKSTIAVVGLGYVGLPLAILFAEKFNVIGFDYNFDKINLYQRGVDPTGEVGHRVIETTKLKFTCNEEALDDCNFFVVAVPTPINEDKTPDLTPLIEASKLVGRHLTKDSIVVYESTVYPGVTEDKCIPLLEEMSHLICGKDFNVGYSPERVNPADKNHRLETIIKIVSGCNQETTNEIANIYNEIIKVGVYKASSIKIAEAAKVIENSQRDINIAFMNEMAMILDKMNIDSKEVMKAMQTKWNALNFYPGLVGGHCIGVDPYYLIYQADQIGCPTDLLIASRKINEKMSQYLVDRIIKYLFLANKRLDEVKIAVMGITFKENCKDIRNSQVYKIIQRLKEFGINPLVVDPVADYQEVKEEYQITLSNLEEVKDVDCVVFAVAHNAFKNLSIRNINKLFKKKTKKIVIDIKSIFAKEQFDHTYLYWSL